jgi:hypothetical protein
MQKDDDMKYVAFSILLFLPLLPAAAQQAAPTAKVVSPDDVRGAVKKSLVYLEKAGQAWIDNKKCVSCHRVSFLTWSYREAMNQGIELPNDKFNEWLEWSVADTTKPIDPKKPIACQINHDGVGQLLIAHAGDAKGGLTEEQRTALVEGLLNGQREDGSWKPGGQLPGQKRPMAETTEVSTMWNVVALGSVQATDAVKSAREKGLASLGKLENAKSTEWYAVKLILAVQQKKDAEVKSHLEQLLKLQHDDGGWGWLTADASDALATGQALYALRLAGSSHEDAAVQNGIQFLCSRQQEDGSWAVKGTKENKKNKVEETATFWGSAWASIALAQSLKK